MPGGSSRKTFIGSRILTRQQFLKGLGGGAMTLGLGYLQACEACEPDPPRDTPRNTRDVIRRYAGQNGLSYLDREVTDPSVVNYLADRAASFGENCEGSEGDIPSDMEISLPTNEDVRPIDGGGIATNDLRLISAVDLERSPVLMDYLSGKLGRDVTPENASAAFLTTRFFATATSLGEGLRPTIGITDSVAATVLDESGQDDQVAADLMLVDCSGMKLQKRGTFDKSAPPAGEKIDRIETIPGRDSLFNAYYDHLVGYSAENGEKVYVPFDPSESQKYNPRYGSVEYGGVRVVEYRSILPDLGQTTSTPPPSASSPPHDANYDYDTAQKQGQLVDAQIESGLVLAGGQTHAERLNLYTLVYDDGQIEFSAVLPSRYEERKGDPLAWPVGAWHCEGRSEEGCTSCCAATATNNYGGIALVGSQALTACGLLAAGVVLCWLSGAVILGGWALVTYYRNEECEAKCRKTFYRVPGSFPGA